MGCAASQEITFVALVPRGATPGQTIQAVVNGNPVLVLVPPGKKPGEIFRFRASECVTANQPQIQMQSPGAGDSEQFSVTVPQGIQPGQSFQIMANGYTLAVTCPPGMGPGGRFVAQVPRAKGPPQQQQHYSPQTVSPQQQFVPPVAAPPRYSNAPVEIEAEPFDPAAIQGYSANGVLEVNAAPYNPPVSAPSTSSGGRQFQVTIPPGVGGGMNFEVAVDGMRMMVQCPPNTPPGSTITIEAPSTVNPSATATAPPTRQQSYSPHAPQSQQQQQPASAPSSGETEQMDIVIPAGTQPGATFEIVSNGTRIGIKCPPNASAGSKIRIQVPKSGAMSPSSPTSTAQMPGSPQTYTIEVPKGATPGSNFEVVVGGKKAMVQCPAGVQPGQQIQIAL